MINLVDASFFVADRTVAQLSQAAVRTELELYIKRYQYDYLVRVMGLNLYKLFETGYAIDPKPQIWVDLVSGAEYVQGGKTCIWQGLANQEFKTSPIADYVYYWYQRDKVTAVVGSGTILPNAENGEAVVNRGRMVSAWNAAREGAKACEAFLESNPTAYPDYRGVSYSNRHYFSPVNLLNL
jgi:hypothetical protein